MEKTYENFKKDLKKDLEEKMCGVDIAVTMVKKTNKSMEAFVCRPAGMCIAPVIYPQDIYREFKKSGNYDKVVTDTVASVNAGIRDAMDGINQENMLKFDENIIFRIINAEQNKEMLKDVPHRIIEDLALVYRRVVGFNDDGCMRSFLITNQIMKDMDTTEEALYRVAKKMTAKITPPSVRTIAEVLNIPMEMMGPEIYIVSNETGIYGSAVAFCCNEILASLSEKIGSDLYLFPSSVHEILAVSAEQYNNRELRELKEIVEAVNIQEVSESDFLSNSVYYYNKETGITRKA